MKAVLFITYLALSSAPGSDQPQPVVTATGTIEFGSMEACRAARAELSEMYGHLHLLAVGLCGPYDISKVTPDKPDPKMKQQHDEAVDSLINAMRDHKPAAEAKQ